MKKFIPFTAFVLAGSLAYAESRVALATSVYGYSSTAECLQGVSTVQSGCIVGGNGIQCTVIIGNEQMNAYGTKVDDYTCLQPLVKRF